jgi:hypothetical protein
MNGGLSFYVSDRWECVYKLVFELHLGLDKETDTFDSNKFLFYMYLITIYLQINISSFHFKVNMLKMNSNILQDREQGYIIDWITWLKACR